MKTSKFYTSYFPLVGILLLSLLVFSPTFFNDFQMGWDDQWMVMNGLTVKTLNWNLVKEIFTTPFNGQWGPLNQLMYTVLYSLFGYNALAFHATSLIVHFVNIILVYVGLRNIFSIRTSWSAKEIMICATLVTILFAIHPFQVETVAWISASKILLSTTFYLLATILFVKYLHEGLLKWYLAVVFMFLMAYLSKEQSVTFPLLAALIMLAFGIKPASLRFWAILIPIGMVGICMCVHEVFFVANYDDYIKGETFVWWERLLLCFYSVATYIFKWLIPCNLNWLYVFPIQRGESIPYWLAAYPVLMLVIVYTFWQVLRKKYVFYGLLFMLIHLILVIHITVLPRAAVIADRYMYLAVLGLNLIIAVALLKNRWCRTHIKIVFASIAIWMITLCTVSFLRVQDWSNTKILRSSLYRENCGVYHDIV